jgi:phage-related protein
VGFRVEFLDEKVEGEADELPVDMRAKLERIVRLLEEFGVSAAREPYVKSLGSGLFEMRITGKDGIARAVYVHATGRRLVIVLVFIKKTQKTPDHVLKLARARAKEVK